MRLLLSHVVAHIKITSTQPHVCLSLFLQTKIHYSTSMLQKQTLCERYVDDWRLSRLSSLLKCVKYFQYLTNHGVHQKAEETGQCSLLPSKENSAQKLFQDLLYPPHVSVKTQDLVLIS